MKRRDNKMANGKAGKQELENDIGQIIQAIKHLNEADDELKLRTIPGLRADNAEALKHINSRFDSIEKRLDEEVRDKRTNWRTNIAFGTFIVLILSGLGYLCLDPVKQRQGRLAVEMETIRTLMSSEMRILSSNQDAKRRQALDDFRLSTFFKIDDRDQMNYWKTRAERAEDKLKTR